MSTHKGWNRRGFLQGAVTGGMAAPVFGWSAQPQLSPNERLKLGFVGVGGRGASSIMALSAHDIVALCDVDERTVAAARSERRGAAAFDEVLRKAESRGARWYTDYRHMLAEQGDALDGVVISTPDHMHFPIALSAINLGLHVYCEKPLTHTVEEARQLAAAAARAGVVTQMGNQGHSNDGVRVAREWLTAGLIGQVREVYSWTNRPVWPQGQGLPSHDEFIPVVPQTLDWRLWQGVAAPRAYDPGYLPFRWRAWWEYGCGAVGDMACHVMDAAFYGLELGLPVGIEAMATAVNEHSAPTASAITYRFPRRGKLPQVTYHWLDGGLLPPAPAGISQADFVGPEGSGTLFIGDEGYLVTDTYTRSVRILPDTRFAEVRDELPEPSLPRIEGTHHEDWIRAIRNGGQACSHFGYAAPLTEIGLLGNVAIRAQSPLLYDAGKMQIANLDSANQFLSKSYPDGWIVS